ncbi:MAG: hypothetical protein J5523_09960 [Muribaculaceae bacterium]|nr:hypothetical protein [Muribaculaceae bacterium]
MDSKYLFLILAILLFPLLMLAQETSPMGTTQETSQTDSLQAADKPHKHFCLFMSDLYVGWGGNTVEAGNRDIIKRSHSEVGILNFLSVGYTFNRERTTLSAGIGFNWASYSLNKPALWCLGSNGVVGFATLAEPFENHQASLLVRSMQFPIMINQNLGKRWNIAAGPVLNWNFYASMTNAHSMGVDDYSVTTHGLNQRKFSVDGFVRVTWHGIGAYLRYAPQSLFKNGFGPEIKNRWSLGLIISGFTK